MAQYAFSEFLSPFRFNRTLLWFTVPALIIQFTIFKMLYPFAGFIMDDSYSYLTSAAFNYDINFFPVGYSKFLRLFSVFSKSDTALVAVQYLGIQLSALWFLFTLFKALTFGKPIKRVLYISILFNPAFLYVANYVSSDALFLSLSFIWITLLLRIIQRPTTGLVALQAVTLFLAFAVRYNALYYPLLTAVALLLTRKSWKFKITGIASSFLIPAAFMIYTTRQYKKVIGISEFSPFSGWQLANNAMYAYRYVNDKHVTNTPVEFQELDKMVRTYFDTSRDLNTHPIETAVANTVYMWDSRSPLQKYMKLHFKADSIRGDFIQWASTAPLYADYGSYLIHQYPAAFFRHYLLQNAIKFYAPPTEFLSTQNLDSYQVANIARDWFEYKSNNVTPAFKNLNVEVLGFLPIATGVIHIVYLFGMISIVVLRCISRQSIPRNPLILFAAFWVVNFGFSVFASPITLRYQLFSIVVFSALALFTIEIVYQEASIPSKK